MQAEALKDFIDPETGSPLKPEAIEVGARGEVQRGVLRGERSGSVVEITECIPRFVKSDNYATNFGLQWQIHAKTQLDSFTGSTQSRDRVRESTGWPDALPGERILEAGSGAGRFTEVLVKSGATVYSFDFSDAVRANFANNGHNQNLVLFQGDIYRIPFPKRSFDKVFCLGVLQHTPNVRKSFDSLAAMVKPGGQLAVDAYPKNIWTLLHWKYLMRPFTKRMRNDRLYRFVEWYAPKLMPVARFMRKVAGRAGTRLVPIMDQSDKAVAPDIQRAWTILDTFDALSPAYDFPQTDETLRRWYAEAGFSDVVVKSGVAHGTLTNPPELRAAATG